MYPVEIWDIFMANIVETIGFINRQHFIGLTRERANQEIEQRGFPFDYSSYLTPQEAHGLGLVADRLCASAFRGHINRHNDVTFAMIRPQLQLGKLSDFTDEEIAGQIRDRIETKFRVPLNFSLPFPRGSWEEFYRHVKSPLERMRVRYPISQASNQWEYFMLLLSSGATTFLLLQNKRFSRTPAWQHWREMMGPTLAKNAQSSTLRGDFGSDYNNIVHGSDSLEFVHKETAWLTAQLERI